MKVVLSCSNLKELIENGGGELRFEVDCDDEKMNERIKQNSDALGKFFTAIPAYAETLVDTFIKNAPKVLNTIGMIGRFLNDEILPDGSHLRSCGVAVDMRGDVPVPNAEAITSELASEETITKMSKRIDDEVKRIREELDKLFPEKE